MNRHVLAYLVSLGGGLLIMPLLLPLLRKLRFGQSIREEGLKSHYKKAGTPTMGGIMLYLALSIGLAVSGQFNSQNLVLLLVAVGHGVLGFADDYIKAALKNPEGLAPRVKLIFQFTLGGLFLYYLFMQGHSTIVDIPFIGNFDFKYFYWVLAILYLVFFSNAVNIIDGVDGLCTGQTLIALAFMARVAFMTRNDSIHAFVLSLMGALTAFLFFNRNPARVFMGDTGSLGLGFALSATALLLKVEVLSLWVGMVFIVDIFSSIIQVIYFKKTKGKRFFKMSPIHHHFEMEGWNEWKIDRVFWSWGIFFALSGWLYYLAR